jgi:ankyrin repeat protein
MEQWPEGMMERDDTLRTPLHLFYAIICGRRTEMVRFLLDGWPEMIWEKDAVGNTPLHFLCTIDTWAMTEEQIKAVIEVVKLLVERWTEGKTALNDEGKTPLQVLVEKVSWQYELRDEVKEELIALVSSP